MKEETPAEPLPEELPEAANQKEIEQKLRELLGPPPQEATQAEILDARGLHPATKPAESLPLSLTPGPVTKEMGKNELTRTNPQIVEPEISESDADIIEDRTTSDAVDDIVADEADMVLASEDAEITKAFVPDKKKSGISLGQFFKSKLGKWATLIVLAVLIIGLAVLPLSRYYILNLLGVRASVNLVVTDDSSQQPLKNIEVTIGNDTASTDSDGKVRLSRVRLGKNNLLIHKRAYADFTKTITVGWGSNPLGGFTLKATGTQYTIVVKDFLSGQPITDAEAGVGEAVSTADKTGKIILSIDSGTQSLVVSINAKSYRSQKVTLTSNSKADQKVSLVPVRKDAFISKRTGRYDLYKINVDGKNEEVVLKGTGLEQDNMVLSVHPSDEVLAYVSTRDNVHNKDGFLLSTLLLVDLGDNSVKNIVQSERVQLLGWSGDYLVYLQITAGTSAFSPKRYRLVSYNYKTADKRELATANYFNDAKLIGNNVYYSLTGLGQNEGSFSRITVDGSSKQQIINQIVWSIYRTSYDKFTLSVGQDWYDNKVGSLTTTKLSGQPSALKSFVYVDSPDKKHSLWVDDRDGKGVLLSYDTVTKTDKIIKTQSGITSSVRWLNNSTIIYRIHTDQETADYVLSVDGGDAKKISDVTNTINIEQGYY